MRIDAHDDYLPGGLTIEEIIEFCRIAGENGVDVLDVSRGNIITAGSVYEVPPIDIPRGFNVENAARIRRETKMATIAVGRINTAEQAEAILEEDKADMVVMGRAQLADPEFCNKARRAGQRTSSTVSAATRLLRRILRFKEQTVYHMSEKSVSGSRGGVEAYKGGDSETGLYRRRRNGRPGGGQGAAHEGPSSGDL